MIEKNEEIKGLKINKEGELEVIFDSQKFILDQVPQEKDLQTNGQYLKLKHDTWETFSY